MTREKLMTASEANEKAMAELRAKYGVETVEEIETVLKKCSDRAEREKEDMKQIVESINF